MFIYVSYQLSRFRCRHILLNFPFHYFYFCLSWFFFWNKSFSPMILYFSFFLFYLFLVLDRYYYFCVQTCLCSELHRYLLWYRISLNAVMLKCNFCYEWYLKRMPHVDESKSTYKNYGANYLSHWRRNLASAYSFYIKSY